MNVRRTISSDALFPRIEEEGPSFVFILGLQRSGTTWLANIFDASPNVLFFMEPFAPAYGIFPEFPEASYFWRGSSNYLCDLLQNEMPRRLLRYKSLLFRKSMIQPVLFRLERLFAGRLVRLLSPGVLQDRIRRFELLNLNRMERSCPIYPKHPAPYIWVIKELRLAGKIPLLVNAFPNANFIVIVRHPCATVHSILAFFERNALPELRQEMGTFIDKISLQPISASYQTLIERSRAGGLTHQLALYWRISYETMFRQLEKHSRTQILVYEQLASSPQETSQQIFARANVPWTDSVEEYLAYSSDKEVKNPGAINTLRKSGLHYRNWQAKISAATQQAVLDITGDSFLLPYFEPYYAS